MKVFSEKVNGIAKTVPRKQLGWPLLLTTIFFFVGFVTCLILLLRGPNCILGNINQCAHTPNKFTAHNLYLRAAVSSDAQPCANVANNIMMIKGGNAVDGAIAGLICDCAVNFHSCGIGGGSFIVIYIKKERKVYAIDLREEAPRVANESMFLSDPKSSTIGGKSIGVMGLVSGYYEIHQKLGKLPWHLLFQQTREILNTGFYVSKTLKRAIEYFEANGNKTKFHELWSVISSPASGKSKSFGDVIKLPNLSKTFEVLIREPHAMKNGSLVRTIISEIRNHGGIITEQDLAQYTVKWRTPIAVEISEGDILYTMPPPSSGVLVAFILNALSGYSLHSSDLDSCRKAGLFFHRFVESLKFAFSQRSNLGDMDFVNVNEIITLLKSKNHTNWIKSFINDDRTHPSSFYNETFINVEDRGTAHFSLVSKEGDAVSATSTINDLFGSFVMGSRTGIIYNNEMDDFSSPGQQNVYNLPPSPSNFIKPKKRPMSSMSPIIIVTKDGNVKLVNGASGGPKIISSTAMVSVLTTLLKLRIKEAMDQPRIHHQLFPNEVVVETNFPKEIIKELQKRGHKVRTGNNIGNVQGVQLSNEEPTYLECTSDFRKMGECDGY